MAKEMSSSFKPMCVFGILGEALKIPLRSGKLILSVALLFVIPTSLLLLGNIFALKPLIMDLMVKSYTLKSIDPQMPRYAELIHGIQREIGIIFGEEIVVLFAFSAIQLFAAVAMIYLSAMAFCAKNLTHKELFWKIGRTWKRPVITWLYTILFSFGFLFSIFLLSGLVLVFFKDVIVLEALGAIIGLLLLLFFLYFSMIWKLAIVVSVMEEGGSGLGAIQKATELIKGKKLQGFLLYLIFELLGFAVSKIIDGSSNLIIGLLVVDVACLVHNLSFIAYTVFYFECKKVHGEKVEMEEGSGYSLVSTNPLVDIALP